MDALSLYWGQSTLEAYSSKDKKAIFIFNFNYRQLQNLQFIVPFVVGRIIYSSKQLQADVTIMLTFDFRRQGVIDSMLDKLKHSILEKTKHFVRNNIQFEFYK